LGARQQWRWRNQGDIMILFRRSSDIAPGQLAPAIGFAKKVSAYLQAEYGRNIEVSMPVGGNPFCIHWTSTFDTLDQFENFNSKLMQDAKYLDMIVNASTCFIAGSARDTLSKTI
jgi:hypothetical protein